LALMIQGDQNKQIAYKLGVGEATVKAHVTVILRKPWRAFPDTGGDRGTRPDDPARRAGQALRFLPGFAGRQIRSKR
jgi:hypothetical protein